LPASVFLQKFLFVSLLALTVFAAVVVLILYLTPNETLQASLILVDQDGSTTPLRLPIVILLRRVSLAASVLLFISALCGWLRRDLLIKAIHFVMEDARAYGRSVSEDVRSLLQPGERWKLAVLAGITLLGIALRLSALDAPMRYDESNTFLYHATQSPLNVVSDYLTPNNHIFHSLLVHYSYELWGDSPIALRLPAFLAGVLLIPASFWLVRRLFDGRTALVAAGLVAVSPPLIGYSANARGYTWLTLLFVLGFTLATRLRERPSLTGWTLWVVVFSLGFFTIPVMLYGYSVTAMWLLLSAPAERRKSLVRELFAASIVVGGLAVLLYLPAAVRTGLEAVVANRFVRALSLEVFFGGLARFLAGLANYWAASWPWALKIVLWGAVGLSLFAPGPIGKKARLLHASILLTVPVILLAQRVLPFTRVFLPFFPLYFALAAVGLTAMAAWLLPKQRAQAVSFSVGLLLVAYLGTTQWLGKRPPTGVFADLEHVMGQLKPLLGKRERIVAAIPLTEPLRYHARRAGLPIHVVQEFRPYWGDRQLGRLAVIYFVEEQKAPRRRFVNFDVPNVRVTHRAFREHFEPPERIGGTEFAAWYRLRRNAPSEPAGSQNPARND
jgi:4-amino-4-deoxy-L-arabinose transferase-like glycosyltransferase